MTVDERFEQLERKTQRLEKRNKRLTVALTMTVVAMAAVVTMAATGDKDGTFDTVTARHIYVTNDAGEHVVRLGANDKGDGLVFTQSAKGKMLVLLGATDNGGGVGVFNKTGKMIVEMKDDEYGNGGAIQVFNKTGEGIVEISADEYGNGVVGAYNRKGKGRRLQPGP